MAFALERGVKVQVIIFFEPEVGVKNMGGDGCWQ